jgi:nucleotide-binding universal stress UspA family protein
MGPAEGRASLKRLLMPLDGSRLAECVLPLGVSLAAHLGARLTLLHVLERRAPSTVHGERHLTGAEEAEGYLSEVSARVLASGVAVDRHVHPNEEDDVAKSIVDHADDLSADLVILATHGGGGALPGRRVFHRVLFGSVAQQVLRRGLRPVLLVRPPDGPALQTTVSPELGRFLVPLDGEPAAEAALPLAATLAAAYRAEVVLRRVVPTLSTLGGERATAARLVPTAAAASLDMEEGEAVRYLEHVAARPLLEGLRINASVLRGDPAQTLLDVAARIAVDMIVMATHGRSGLDAVLTGSVASRIAARFLKPLLLVRAPRGAASPAGAPS